MLTSVHAYTLICAEACCVIATQAQSKRMLHDRLFVSAQVLLNLTTVK